VVIHLSPSDQFQFMFDDVEISLAQAAKRLSETNIRLCLDILTPPTLTPLIMGLWPIKQSIWQTGRYTVLGQVREVAFGPDVAAPSPAAFPTWLSMFPLLEHVEFLNARVGLDHEIKMSLLRFIGQTCASVRSVRIGGDTRDVSAWLSSDNY
jgi:hypothetical protein